MNPSSEILHWQKINWSDTIIATFSTNKNLGANTNQQTNSPA